MSLLRRILHYVINRSERRVGVKFEYVHHIADTSVGLLWRYTKIFRFLEPNTSVPRECYHAARLRGAIAAGCGTCVEVEINLAYTAKVDHVLVRRILLSDYASLPMEVAAVGYLADAVVGQRIDHPEARSLLRNAYGDAGLIELAFAMNGAALLPGIKRALGYANACDIRHIHDLLDSR